MNKIDVSVVIGSEEKFIVPCIDSLYTTYKKPVRIFIVSNLASQEIINEIKTRFPDTHVIANKEKKGFAENHNHVIEKTDSEYILILNDDIKILDGAIEKLIDYMDKNPSVAIISPKLLNPDLSLQQSTYGFPNLFAVSLDLFGIRKLIPFSKFTYKIASVFLKKGGSRFWPHDRICEVDTLGGASVLVRRKAIEEVGLMDEVCLAYGEETEWHCRFKKTGWKIVFYPDAEVIHYRKQTTKNLLSIREEEIKGLLNFFRKHRSSISYLALRTIIIISSFFRYLFLSMIFRKKQADMYLRIMGIALDPQKVFRNRRVFEMVPKA